MIFRCDDDVKRYFKEAASKVSIERFKVGEEIYLLTMIVTNYSQIYSQQNGTKEWIVMNSGTAVKIG